MRYQALLAAVPLLILAGCGGGQVSDERRVIRFGKFRCTQPGVDVRRETTFSTNVSASLGSSESDSSSSSSEETTSSSTQGMADRFLSVLKAIRDVKVETGQSITRKNERIAKLAGRGSELEVITYKLCEAAGNGLIDKAQYQKFLEITLQAPPAPASDPNLPPPPR